MGFSDDDEAKDSKDVSGSLLGYFAAIMVPILSAVVSIWTRQCRQVNASILMFWFATGALFWSLIGGKQASYSFLIFASPS